MISYLLRRKIILAGMTFLLVGPFAGVSASAELSQLPAEPRPLTPQDYGKWESLGPGRGGGRWGFVSRRKLAGLSDPKEQREE